MLLMGPGLLLGIVSAYFLVLILIARITGKDASNEEFFLAGRNSPWYVVAFGMIGASLSGVTFISVPGLVGIEEGRNMNFSYMQMVLGYLVGYAVIMFVLMPIYYRLQLTSIYAYLEERLGKMAYKTGAAYFLLSRTVGASLRLFLVVLIFDQFITGPLGVPFVATVAIIIALIWVYTFQGGINTIIWTDTLQTFFMILAVVLTILSIGSSLDKSWWDMVEVVRSSKYSRTFFFSEGWVDPNNFFKQFLSGALIALVMTGLDQDMMQKNLSCRNLREAQWNMGSFSVVLVFVNLLFLFLGALLYIYFSNFGFELPSRTDKLFPTAAIEHLGTGTAIVFLIGLMAATYSSADSALTALTTSFCVDFLGFKDGEDTSQNRNTRWLVHIGFSLVLLLLITLFNALNDEAVVTKIFILAGYTYGPLLGLFAFGILTSYKVNDKGVLPVCILAPVLSYWLNTNNLFIGFSLGNLIILLNGLITFFGLWILSFFTRT